MRNNRKTLVNFLIIIIGLIVIVFVIKNLPTREEVIAKEIIQSYIETNGLVLKPGSEEYIIFMRRIVWGEVPELSQIGSEYFKTTEELECVNAYAWKYSGYEDRYGGYEVEEDLEEAVIPTSMD